jgi:hypothetical protein
MYLLCDMKITQDDILKMHSKARRENTIRIKPTVTIDKKKKANKNACRKKVNY